MIQSGLREIIRTCHNQDCVKYSGLGSCGMSSKTQPDNKKEVAHSSEDCQRTRVLREVYVKKDKLG